MNRTCLAALNSARASGDSVSTDDAMPRCDVLSIAFFDGSIGRARNDPDDVSDTPAFVVAVVVVVVVVVVVIGVVVVVAVVAVVAVVVVVDVDDVNDVDDDSAVRVAANTALQHTHTYNNVH